jgi:hypothetical protein
MAEHRADSAMRESHPKSDEAGSTMVQMLEGLVKIQAHIRGYLARKNKRSNTRQGFAAMVSANKLIKNNEGT